MHNKKFEAGAVIGQEWITDFLGHLIQLEIQHFNAQSKFEFGRIWEKISLPNRVKVCTKFQN